MKRLRFWRRPETGPSGDEVEGSGLLTGNPHEDSQSLEILLDAIAEVTANTDLEQLLHDIVGKALEVTQAERGILFLGDDPERLSVRVVRDREQSVCTENVQYSRSVVRSSLDSGNAVRSVVQSDQEALELGKSVYDLKLRAVMCAPLLARERSVGAIYVDSRAMRREFSSRDLALFGAMSAQLAIAVENARLHADSLEKVRLQQDVDIARRIQQHLLPPVPKDAEGLDFSCRFTAAEQASGDTYDFFPLSGGRVAVLIGDVTGHGVGAALLTHAAQAALRSYLELLEDPAEVVTRLNNRLVDSVETGNFMSLLLLVLDPGAGTMCYVNAGHPGLRVINAEGSETHDKTGMVLGVVGDQRYEVSATLPMKSGDLLFLRTDGIDESMSPNREMFGEDRLHALLTESRQGSAEEVLQAVDRAIDAHTGGGSPEDDLTMIAIKVR